MKIDKILLTSDLSDEALRAFEPVNELARERGATVELLHVIEDVPMPAAGAPLAPPLHTPDLEASMKAAREKLDSQRAELGDDIEVRTNVFATASPAESICDHAMRIGAGLIVMATHGRTGFRRLLLGSVTEGVVRHTRVPVLVIPREA